MGGPTTKFALLVAPDAEQISCVPCHFHSEQSFVYSHDELSREISITGSRHLQRTKSRRRAERLRDNLCTLLVSSIFDHATLRDRSRQPCNAIPDDVRVISHETSWSKFDDRPINGARCGGGLITYNRSPTSHATASTSIASASRGGRSKGGREA